MKEIFQEYGGTDTSGPIGSAFQTLVKNFIDQANKNTGLPTP